MKRSAIHHIYQIYLICHTSDSIPCLSALSEYQTLMRQKIISASARLPLLLHWDTADPSHSLTRL